MDAGWRVPPFDAAEFLPRRRRHCVCVFAVDEGERLAGQLGRMAPLADRVDVVVADGGSSDGSADPGLLRGLGVGALLVKRGGPGLGSQMRMAFAWALRRGYEGVVVVDGNGKDGVGAVPAFVDRLEEGFDHVQGSRFLPGGHHENTPLARLVGVRALHAPLVRLASGFPYTDTTNGFRAYSARLLGDGRVAVFRDAFTGYELHYYLAVRAPRLGFRCVEVPVSRRYPGRGPVPTKIGAVAGNLGVLLKLSMVLLGRYDP